MALPHVEWNLEERGESTTQRLDRNYVELLQELRVAQTAASLLFAFLLGLAFTPRFAALNEWQRGTYVVVLVCAAVSAMVVLAPVLHHRLVFRRRLKQRLVQVSHACALIGIGLMMVSLLGTLAIATSMVIGWWAAVLSGCLAVLFVVVCCGLPLWDRAAIRKGGAVSL